MAKRRLTTPGAKGLPEACCDADHGLHLAPPRCEAMGWEVAAQDRAAKINPILLESFGAVLHYGGEITAQCRRQKGCL
jgi:hypothetical protein